MNFARREMQFIKPLSLIGIIIFIYFFSIFIALYIEYRKRLKRYIGFKPFSNFFHYYMIKHFVDKIESKPTLLFDKDGMPDKEKFDKCMDEIDKGKYDKYL